MNAGESRKSGRRRSSPSSAIRSGRTCFVFGWCVVVLFVGATAFGDETGSAGERDPLAPDAIASRLSRVRSELAAVDAAGEVGDTLAAIESLLDRQRALVEAPASAPSTDEVLLREDAPASIETLAALHRARVETERIVREALGALERAERRAAESSAAAEAAERLGGRALDEGTTSDAPAERARQLAARLAREEAHLHALELRAARAAADRSSRLEDIDRRIEAVRARVSRGEGVPGAVDRGSLERDARLARKREQHERERARIELEIQSLESRFAAPGGRQEELLVAIDALRSARDSLRHTIETIDGRLTRLRERRSVLDAWEAALRDRLEDDARRAAADALRSRGAALARARHRLEVRQAMHARTEAALEAQLAAGGESADVREALRRHRATLRVLVRHEEEALHELEADEAVLSHALEALDEGGLAAGDLWRDAAERGRTLWHYELGSVQGSPITPGAIVIAISLIGVGIWVSRRLSRRMADASRRRFHLDPGASYAIETLVFYLLVASFGLFALRVVHFPLTAFTFAGGALAIGVGFGSQNVMNNFISGLILMLERPVRAHDTVEVDGRYGTIERIGARSTRIRENNGRQVIVPNSFFLESNVVNWTLSDDLIRTSVVVGVAYGSPTRLVASLINQVVDELPEVLREPAPLLLFDDFGSDALVFEVIFWVEARAPMQLRKVASQVRFRIDDAFREHGVVIAFPQRDVHLDTTRPLDVRMVAPDAADAAEDRDP